MIRIGTPAATIDTPLEQLANMGRRHRVICAILCSVVDSLIGRRLYFLAVLLLGSFGGTIRGSRAIHFVDDGLQERVSGLVPLVQRNVGSGR